MEKTDQAPATASKLIPALVLLAASWSAAQVPDAPALVSPQETASGLMLSETFVWNTSPGATAYRLQVSTDPAFATTVYDGENLTDTSQMAQTFLPSTIYFWRVQAGNTSGTSPWSSIRMFTTVVPLPDPDSAGWMRLFRGDNVQDFFIANNGSQAPARVQIAFPNDAYQVTGDTIQVSSGSPFGQVYFKQPFSHYILRFQMRMPGGLGNAGVLMHVQANDPTLNGFPVSVEAQGDPGQGMGQLWPIGNVWVDVRGRMVSGRMQYDPDEDEVTYGGANWNSRVVVGVDGWGQPSYESQLNGDWIDYEIHAHGSDSMLHIVGGELRIKYRNPRVSAGGTPDNVSKFLDRGLIGWQREGVAVWYRNLEIKLLPDDPLYESTSGIHPRRHEIKSRNEEPRLLLQDGKRPAVIHGSPGFETFYDLRGRSMGGQVPRQKLEQTPPVSE